MSRNWFEAGVKRLGQGKRPLQFVLVFALAGFAGDEFGGAECGADGEVYSSRCPSEGDSGASKD